MMQWRLEKIARENRTAMIRYERVWIEEKWWS